MAKGKYLAVGAAAAALALIAYLLRRKPAAPPGPQIEVSLAWE